jgi:hypothetical protein
VTCRVARSFQSHAPQVDLVYCCKCGSENRELFWTSKALGPHLCPMCVQSNVEAGKAESMTRLSRRGRVQAGGDTSQEYALQSTRRT